MRNKSIIGKITIITALMLAGCTNQTFTGAAILESDYDQLEPGSSREEVIEILGAPSFAGEQAETDWYYVTTEWSRRLFLPRRVVKREIKHLQFDSDEQLFAKNNYDISDIKPVKPHDHITPTLGVETSLVKEIFGNIGAINQ